MFNQPSHPVSLINATILWPEFRWVSCSGFCPNVRAVQMSCSFLVHFSFSFYRSCQADYRHVLSRSLARHFYGWNLARVSLRIFVRGRGQGCALARKKNGSLSLNFLDPPLDLIINKRACIFNVMEIFIMKQNFLLSLSYCSAWHKLKLRTHLLEVMVLGKVLF